MFSWIERRIEGKQMKENGMENLSFFTIWFTVKKRLENGRCIISPNWGENEKEKGVWMVDDSSAFFFFFFYTNTTD